MIEKYEGQRKLRNVLFEKRIFKIGFALFIFLAIIGIVEALLKMSDLKFRKESIKAHSIDYNIQSERFEDSMNVAIRVELSVKPTHITKDTLLDIRGTVHNVGSSQVDTQIWASTLLINGDLSENWSWAIANGFRDERESALPPGERIEFRRLLPSSSLIPKRGIYKLVLIVRGIRSATVTVEKY